MESVSPHIEIQYLFGDVITRIDGQKQTDNGIRKILQGGQNYQEVIVPPGVKYMSEYGTRLIVTQEVQPQVVTLQVGANGKETKFPEGRFLVSLPYLIIVYVLHAPTGQPLQNPYVYFRNQPLTSIDDPLYVSILPNMDSNGATCLGSSYLTSIGQSTMFSDMTMMETFYRIVSRTPGYILGSAYNMDCGFAGLELLRDSNFDDKCRFDYSVWERETKKNPGYGLTVDWNRSTVSLHSLHYGLHYSMLQLHSFNLLMGKVVNLAHSTVRGAL